MYTAGAMSELVMEMDRFRVVCVCVCSEGNRWPGKGTVVEI